MQPITPDQYKYLYHNFSQWSDGFLDVRELSKDHATALIGLVERAKDANTALLRARGAIREHVMGLTNKKTV